MKNFIFLTLLLFGSSHASGQDYLKVANDCFEKGDYECAKRYYTLFQTFDGRDMGTQIQKVDECLRSLNLADDYFRKMEYEKAYYLYQMVLDINPKDQYAKKQHEECNRRIPNEITPTVRTTILTLRINERYKLQIEPSNNAYAHDALNHFRIITPEDGSLTISFETFAEMTTATLFNENGVLLQYTLEDIVLGKRVRNTGKYSYGRGIRNDGLLLQWNTTAGKFVGSFTYKLDAGIYYLRITRSQKGISTANLSLVFRDLDGIVIR